MSSGSTTPEAVAPGEPGERHGDEEIDVGEVLDLPIGCEHESSTPGVTTGSTGVGGGVIGGSTSGGGSGWKGSTGWGSVADAKNLIMVWPDGVGSSWNLGHCCETALNEKVDDVAFVRAMVEQLESDTCIDPKRVYATGCSNGGGMTYKVACEAADVIAAAAPVDVDCVVVPTNDPWGLFEKSALP